MTKWFPKSERHIHVYSTTPLLLINWIKKPIQIYFSQKLRPGFTSSVMNTTLMIIKTTKIHRKNDLFIDKKLYLIWVDIEFDYGEIDLCSLWINDIRRYFKYSHIFGATLDMLIVKMPLFEPSTNKWIMKLLLFE